MKNKMFEIGAQSEIRGGGRIAKMIDREKVIKGLNDIGGFVAEKIGIEQARNFIQTIDDACAMLKEREIGHWILLENCSNSGVYCSECQVKVFDSYPFKKKLSYFCPHCGTRMEGETERY